MANDASRKKLDLGLPIYIIAALVVLGGALLGYLQFSGSRTRTDEMTLTPEARQYVGNLKLSPPAMKASENYFKQMVTEITGQINNAGDRRVKIVEVYCVFYDSYGQLVLRERVPIVSAAMGGLKPDETKSYRLAFDDIPESWNHLMPQLVIAGIKFE